MIGCPLNTCPSTMPLYNVWPQYGTHNVIVASDCAAYDRRLSASEWVMVGRYVAEFHSVNMWSLLLQIDVKLSGQFTWLFTATSCHFCSIESNIEGGTDATATRHDI